LLRTVAPPWCRLHTAISDTANHMWQCACRFINSFWKFKPNLYWDNRSDNHSKSGLSLPRISGLNLFVPAPFSYWTKLFIFHPFILDNYPFKLN
jgi:hypothetical protein